MSELYLSQLVSNALATHLTPHHHARLSLPRASQVDIVSCHPTLMLAVLRKMVLSRAIDWDEDDTLSPLHKLLEYAALDANGEPSGRLPMLRRIARHFGVSEAAAKDVIKVLVLRVLNGGSVAAWCREMDITCPQEPQADLRDLAEVARVVRGAFFSMLEEQKGTGALQALRGRVQAVLRDKHARKVQHARSTGSAEPQPPSGVACERTMFSHCIFELEDLVLDCIDRKLRELGWTVASLIFDGVRSRPRSFAIGRTRPPHAALSRAFHMCAHTGARRAPRGRGPNERAARGGGRRQGGAGLHHCPDREAALRPDPCRVGRGRHTICILMAEGHRIPVT